VTSKTNVGDARITGVEFNYAKKLDFLPGWGRYFSLNANATKLQLTGPNGTDFEEFIPKTANIGLSYNKRPFNVRVSWNYRGRQIRNSLTGAEFDIVTTPATPGNGNFTEYYEPRYNLDTNFEYVLSKRLRFFFNARNITNVTQRLLRHSPTSAVYAQGRQSEEFGVQLAAGIKGSY
jgi:outer membrane receptor protein involved in Fe transport